MKKRLLIGSLCLLAIILGLFAWVMFDASRPEPSYQGKPLSYWLQGFDPLVQPGGINFGQTPVPSREEAEVAMKIIGPDAVPTLMRMLKRKDSKLKTAVINVAHKQKFFNVHVHEDVFDNSIALEAIHALGPGFSNAIPQLIAFFDSDPSPFPQQAIPFILGEIGPAAKSAIPILLRGVAHTNSLVRNNCVWALSMIHSDSDVVVPALMKCLNDPDPFVVAHAAFALGSFRSNALPALPTLLQLSMRQPLPGRTGPNFPTLSVSRDWQPGPLHPKSPPDIARLARISIDNIERYSKPRPD